MADWYLEHLSDVEIDQTVAECYWERDRVDVFTFPVAEVADLVGLNARSIGSFVHARAAFVSDEIRCAKCFQGYRAKNRQDYLRARVHPHPFICDVCRQSTRSIHEDRIREFVGADELRQPAGARDFALIHAITLAACRRVGGAGGSNAITDVRSWQSALAPSPEYTHAATLSLHAVGHLLVDPKSSPEAFIWTEHGPTDFYWDRVAWRIAPLAPGRLRGSGISEVEEQLFAGAWQRDWVENLESVHAAVAQMECEGFFLGEVARYHWDVQCVESARAAIDKALTRFSPAQVFNLIYRSMRNLAAWTVADGLASEQIIASQGGNFLAREVKMSLERGFKIYPYRRQDDDTPSALTRVLCDALGVDDTEFLKSHVGTFHRGGLSELEPGRAALGPSY